MINLPITCSNKYGQSKQTPFTVFNGWIRRDLPEYDEIYNKIYCKGKEINITEFTKRLYHNVCTELDIYAPIHGGDKSNKVYRDSNGKRIAGLIEHKKDNIAYMGIFCDGYLLKMYSYPNIDIPFKSSMVRWWNLFYCGRWSIRNYNNTALSSDDALLDAVLNKEKPMGFVVFQNDKVKEVVKRIKKAGLHYHVEPHDWIKDKSSVSICQKGTVGEVFDINGFLLTYTIMSYETKRMFLNKDDYDFFRSLKDKPLKLWLKGWDHSNPVTNRDLVLAGLLFGYAIESTISLLILEQT